MPKEGWGVLIELTEIIYPFPCDRVGYVGCVSGEFREKNGLLLEGKGISKYFGGLAAVSDVSFHIPPGETGLIGPNGAGKTTRLIAGDAGNPCLPGDCRPPPERRLQNGIARTFQITKPFLELTVLENALVGAFFGHQQKRRMEEAKERALSSLTGVGLAAKAEKRARILWDESVCKWPGLFPPRRNCCSWTRSWPGSIPKKRWRWRISSAPAPGRDHDPDASKHVMRAIMGLSDRLIVLHYGKRVPRPRRSPGSPR